jgi:hypothetical protein
VNVKLRVNFLTCCQDRAIAAELGVHHETVRQARKKSTAGFPAVGKTIGMDGKARRFLKAMVPETPGSVITNLTDHSQKWRMTDWRRWT